MPDPDGVDLGLLIRRVEAQLLGGEPEYTRADVASRTGWSQDDTQQLWRALGLASVDDDVRAFTDDDVEAVRAVDRLRELTALDDDQTLAMTRVIGQSFARLASWQGQRVVEVVEAHPELLADASGASLDELLGVLTPTVQQLHDYVWRRQMAVVLARLATNAVQSPGSASQAVVGFVDMEGFTTFTRTASEAELRSVINAFERLSSDVVAEHGGQIVKMIGDEVLFVCESPAGAAEIALELLESAAAAESLPQVRGGLAYGAVVGRLGDVFGQTVNIASRLASLARTDSVLIDENLAAELEGDDRFALRSLRPSSVRGYRHLKSWRLQRA